MIVSEGFTIEFDEKWALSNQRPVAIDFLMYSIRIELYPSKTIISRISHWIWQEVNNICERLDSQSFLIEFHEKCGMSNQNSFHWLLSGHVAAPQCQLHCSSFSWPESGFPLTVACGFPLTISCGLMIVKNHGKHYLVFISRWNSTNTTFQRLRDSGARKLHWPVVINRFIKNIYFHRRSTRFQKSPVFEHIEQQKKESANLW